MQVRLHNPQHLGTRQASRRGNPGELLTLGFLNPERKATMKSKTKKKKPAAHSSNASRQKNPSIKAHAFKKSYRPKKHRNPENFLGSLSKPVDFFKAGLLALIGLVVTRQVPQLILKTNNKSWLGYGANAITAGAAGYAAHKFVSKSAGAAVAIGGGLYLVNRILSEKLSPVGQYLSLAGTGDAVAASHVGRLQYAYFPFPVVRDKSGKVVIPKEIDAAAAVAAASAAMRPAPASILQGNSRLAGGRLAA